MLGNVKNRLLGQKAHKLLENVKNRLLGQIEHGLRGNVKKTGSWGKKSTDYWEM